VLESTSKVFYFSFVTWRVSSGIIKKFNSAGVQNGAVKRLIRKIGVYIWCT
jgi:hypothetical protein